MDELILSPEQEQQILDLWNANPSKPPSIQEITNALFGEGFDGRSAQGRAVKKFLASRKLRAKTTGDKGEKVGSIELTEPHKQLIANNLSTMNALELAKMIFANPALTNLNAETRAVSEYIKSLNPRVVGSAANDNIPDGDYTPPKTMDQVIKRVNIYVNYVPDREKVTPTQKKNLEMLIGYLHTYRFIAQMNNYENISERTLCEDTFIRATHDKPDLAQEEVDQYIEYANQVVQGVNIQRRSNILQAQLETLTSNNEPDSMKISMGLVEAIGKASTEYHQCKQREQKLLSDLKQKRSDRMSQAVEESASVLNLVQAWRNYETRQEMLAHAAREQLAVAQEVNKLSTMSELKARILGLNKEGILNG